MAISIGDALLKLGVDSKDLEKGMAEAEKNVQKTSQNIEKAITKITQAATVMGVALIAGIMKVTTDYGKLGEQLLNLNVKTGISVKGLSELKYILESAGGSLSDVEMASKGLSNALEAASPAFEKLGLSIEQLQAMDPEQRFWAVANAVAAIPDPMTRAALAQDVFGRSGTNLLPILAQGTDAIEAQRKTANDLGIVMDDISAKKAAAFDQAMDDMKAAFDGLKMVLAEDVMPVLKDFVVLLTDKLKVAVQWFKDNPGWVDSMNRFGEVLAGIIAAGTIIKMITLIQKLVTSVRAYITAMVIAQSVTGWGIAKVLLGLGAAAGTMYAINKMFETPGETVEDKIATSKAALDKALKDKAETDRAVATAKSATETKAVAGEKGTPGNPFTADEWIYYISHSRSLAGYKPKSYQFGGIVPGPIGQPVPIMAHGGETYLGLQNMGKPMGNNVTINLGVLPGDDVTIRRVVRMIKDVLGEDSRRNSFGQVNQGYFYGRSSV